jgi:hypothetical protein
MVQEKFDREHLLQEFVKAKFEVLLVEIKATRQKIDELVTQNEKEHDEIFTRLRNIEQWMAACAVKEADLDKIKPRIDNLESWQYQRTAALQTMEKTDAKFWVKVGGLAMLSAALFTFCQWFWKHVL